MADLNGLTTAELQRLIDENRARQAGGSAAGVLPERVDEAVGFSSFAGKSFGAGAATAGMIDGKSFSYYEPWGNPLPRMNHQARQYWLTKSLTEFGYKGTASRFKSFGDFLRAGYHGHRTGEFQDRCAAPYKAMNEQGRQMIFKARGMGTTFGPNGGFLVQPEFAPSIEDLVFENDIPDRVKMLPFSGPIVKIPRSTDTDRSDGRRSSGAYARWLDEAQPIAETKLRVDFRELRMKKLAVVVFLTEEVMTDTDYAIESFVRSKIQEEFNFQLARTIFWGNGGAEPLGFANASNKIVVAPLGTQGADSLVTRNFLDMESRFFNQSGSKPTWYHHRSCIPQIGLLDIANQPVMIDYHQGGFAVKPAKTIRGIEAMETEFAAALGDVGDLWLMDLSQYVAISRKTIREDLSIHVEFLTDQQAIRFIFGFDGAPLHDNPIQPYRAGATTPPTLAPFVCLDAR